MAYRTAKQVIIGDNDEDIEEFLFRNPTIKFSTYVKELIRADIRDKEQNDKLHDIEDKLDTLLELVRENGGAANGQPSPAAQTDKPALSEGSRKAATAMMGTFGIKSNK